jgi:predicted ATP-grasp superfamily ATP-dependent carboligase
VKRKTAKCYRWNNEGGVFQGITLSAHNSFARGNPETFSSYPVLSSTRSKRTMISVLQHGPARRTFEDDDEEFVNAQEFVESGDRVQIVFNSEIPENSVEVAILSFSLWAKCFTDATVKSLGMSSVGSLSVDKKKTPLATIYYSAATRALVVLQCFDIPDDLGHACMDAISSLSPKKYIILGAFSVSSYFGTHEEGSLLTVTTAAFRDAVASTSLESGNVVAGAAAAAIAFAQARSIPAALFITLTKPYLTIHSMKAFESLAAMLEGVIGSVVTLPTAADYAALIKRDPYVLKTENMYS